jgi:hypothetical protein
MPDMGCRSLVPIDARIQREADVPMQAMRLVDVMNMLAGVPSKTRIVILDACRNNPFSEINKTTSGPPVSIGIGMPIGRGGGYHSGPIRSGPPSSGGADDGPAASLPEPSRLA